MTCINATCTRACTENGFCSLDEDIGTTAAHFKESSHVLELLPQLLSLCSDHGSNIP